MNAAELIAAVSERFPEAVSQSHSYRGDATLTVQGEALLKVADHLKQDPDLTMDFLMDLTAVDYSTFGSRSSPAFFASSGVQVRATKQIPDEDPWPGTPDGARFAIVAHFYSSSHKHRLRLVVPLQGEDPEVDSLAGLWPGADWL